MKSFNIITKVLQVRLKKDNTTAIRHILCYAAVLLGIAALLIGCPDSADDDNGSGNGNGNGNNTAGASEATVVQGVNSTAVSYNALTLTWTDPQDVDGYIGVAISTDSTVADLPTTVAATLDTPRSVEISGLTRNTEYTFTVESMYRDSNKNNGTDITVTTRSNQIDPLALMITTITDSSVTLSWEHPTDTIGYEGVEISASPTPPAGSTLASAQLQDRATTTLIVTGLASATPYIFTFTSTFSEQSKNSTISSSTPTMTLNTIDLDGDNLIDINSLERLNNVRYNLDVGAPADTTAGTPADDGRYKESTQTANSEGILCGNAAATPCIGYELTRDLDFADSGSYASGMVNNAWRPNDDDPDMASNAGWEPIGSCNTDDDGGGATSVCGDSDDTPLATRFVGNGHTINNLFVRNNSNAFGVASGLFGITNEQATIHAVTLDSASIYGGSNADRIGALVGRNEGTITESAAHGTVAGNGAGDQIGMLVGRNNGTISASYATGTVDGGAGDSRDTVGGLVGLSSGIIIASYASSTVDGGMGGDAIGGLAGVSSDTSTIVASSADSMLMAEIGNDTIGGLVGSVTGVLIANYSRSAVVGGAGDDTIGGLVGDLRGNASALTASYATGAVDGGGANDIVGGLLGDSGDIVPIIASYATGAVTGGSSGTADTVGALRGSVQQDPDGISASYGFGVVSNADIAGVSHIDDRPSAEGVRVGTSTMGAALLLAPDSSDTTNTAVPTSWNSASSNTLDAWDFGDPTQIPVLRYADYDGTGNPDNTYGCIDADNPTSDATIVIPNRVPDGMGGMRTIICGSTLLHSQVR